MVFYAGMSQNEPVPPEGHGSWSDPLDGASRIHHGSHETPLEGLPSTIHEQRVLYRISNQMCSPPDKVSITSYRCDKKFVRIGSHSAERVLAGAHRAFTNARLWRTLQTVV